MTTPQFNSVVVPSTPEHDWEHLPPDWTHDDVADVVIDEDGSVFVLARWSTRVIVYSPEGLLKDSWGEDLFSDRPHGLTLAKDGTLYCVDELDHVVRQVTKDGTLLRTIGTVGKKSDTGYDDQSPGLFSRNASIAMPAGPFHRPTAVAVTGDNHLFVTDGYGNSRVHHFDSDGELVESWGTPGTGPGEFHLPHAIVDLGDGRLAVADRENERLQIFDYSGRLIDIWTDTQRPSALTVDNEGRVYIGELAWCPGERSWTAGPVSRMHPARLSVFEPDGTLTARVASPPLGEEGAFVAPHGIALNRNGDVFLGEVSATYCRLNGLPTDGLHSLLKLVRP